MQETENAPARIALAHGEVLHANSLATVTRNYIAFRRQQSRAETIIGLPSISRIKRVRTTNPGFLVISSSLYLLAAAAFCSKQGDQAAIPLGVVGTIFLFAYFTSRRGALALVVEGEVIETRYGSLKEAKELATAIVNAWNS